MGNNRFCPFWSSIFELSHEMIKNFSRNKETYTYNQIETAEIMVRIMKKDSLENLTLTEYSENKRSKGEQYVTYLTSL